MAKYVCATLIYLNPQGKPARLGIREQNQNHLLVSGGLLGGLLMLGPDQAYPPSPCVIPARLSHGG